MLSKEQLKFIGQELNEHREGIGVYIVDLFSHIQALEADNKRLQAEDWISVDDDLPKIGKRVIILTDYGGMDVCRRRDEDDGYVLWINCMRPQHSNGSVTHWRDCPTRGE